MDFLHVLFYTLTIEKMAKTYFYRWMQIKTNGDDLYFICDWLGAYTGEYKNTLKKAKAYIDADIDGEDVENYGEDAVFCQMHY